MTVNKINIFQSPNDIGINNCRSILLPSTIRKTHAVYQYSNVLNRPVKTKCETI